MKVFVFLLLFSRLCLADVNQDLFFPFGTSEEDVFLAANDDGSTDELPITTVFPFFDHEHTSLFVNNNGAISFLASVSQYTPDPFPLADGRRLLTPFWGDVDTRNGGTLSYREVLRFAQNEDLFLEADGIIRTSFVEMRNFVSSWMYIATWDRVAFFGASDTTIRNSFQAVLITDRRYSFAIFNYGDINWTTGTDSGGDSDTGLGGAPAQAGFNAGDGVTFYNVPGSQTSDVVDIEETSNIGVPGRWVFRTDYSSIEALGCTSSGELSLFPLVGSMLGKTQILISGPCFNSTSQVVCDFNLTQTSGRLLSNKTALCVSPTFYGIGRIPLRVSLDGGVSFDFHGVFTIISPEDEPTRVNSPVTESSHAEVDFTITWDTDALENVDEVDVQVYGSREENDVNFDGPLVILAQRIDYHLGKADISLSPHDTMHYDIGVIGVTESEQQGDSSARAALWSKVHVLQWLNGDNTTDRCDKWLKQEENSDHSFLEVTPTCPCTFDQAQLDIGRFSPDIVKPDMGGSHRPCRGDQCTRRPNTVNCVRANVPSELGGGQQCCYGDDGMIVNVFDSAGGGYSHRYHHGGVAPYGQPKKVPYLSHYLGDILPWTYCCRYEENSATGCRDFGRHRPSQVCNNYKPPIPAQGNSDPHIATLDSTFYTFNGHGEFTMLDALNGTFVLQARAAPLPGIANATVFVAIAAQYSDSDIIHVQTNERRILDAYVRLVEDGQNFTRIDFDQASRWTYSGVSVTGRNISDNGILVAFDRGVGLKLRASEGAMSILLVAPDSFRDQTQGLMGTWNGNASDDFLTPQGSLLSPNMTNEQLHYQFGLQWEVEATKSLFYYEPGTDHEYHTDRSYRPIFDPVINPSVNQTLVEEVCGTNQFCIFDFHTTGSQNFAQNSVQEVEQYERAVEISTSFVSCPTISSPLNGSVIVSTYLMGGVARFACNDGFESSHVVTLTCQSNGAWTDGDTPTCIEGFPQTMTVSENLTPCPQMTTMLSNEPEGLPIRLIVLILFVLVVFIAAVSVVVLVIIKLCRQKKPTIPNSISTIPNQAVSHANPTFVKIQSLK